MDIRSKATGGEGKYGKEDDIYFGMTMRNQTKYVEGRINSLLWM